jgi:hypothetical protein
MAEAVGNKLWSTWSKVFLTISSVLLPENCGGRSCDNRRGTLLMRKDLSRWASVWISFLKTEIARRSKDARMRSLAACILSPYVQVRKAKIAMENEPT